MPGMSEQDTVPMRSPIHHNIVPPSLCLLYAQLEVRLERFVGDNGALGGGSRAAGKLCVRELRGLT